MCKVSTCGVPEGAISHREDEAQTWKAVCIERCKHGVRREARCDIPAASRGNWGKVSGLLAYLKGKPRGD